MKILQINMVYGRGSTGIMAKLLSEQVISAGHEAYIAYDGYDIKTFENGYRIGNKWVYRIHANLFAKYLDLEGRGSFFSTLGLCRWMDKIKPDIIHLHNIHGSYVNLSLLFKYINRNHVPVVMTLHDCWTMTGHCYHFESIGCDRWKSGCYDCPLHSIYPVSVGKDRSKKNYLWKKDLFNSVERMHIVSVSHFIDSVIAQSYLSNCNHSVIHNGIDVSVFTPIKTDLRKRLNIEEGKIIVLGVSSGWSKEKGLKEMIFLSQYNRLQVIMIGVQRSLLTSLPNEIIALQRTESQKELAEYYSMADVFVNPTYNDSFPTVNLEALACGTPVVTYRTGGSPEAIDESTGSIVGRGDHAGLLNAVIEMASRDKRLVAMKCRKRAEMCFNQRVCYLPYMNIYEQLCAEDKVK